MVVARVDNASGLYNGGGGNDILDGGQGDHVLVGGVGTDWLTGGPGVDRFIFASTAHTSLAVSDVIFGFDGAGDPGGDIIDISNASGLAFVFVGSNTFAAGSTSQIRVFNGGTDIFVQLDTDADTGAEAQIRITGEHALAM